MTNLHSYLHIMVLLQQLHVVHASDSIKLNEAVKIFTRAILTLTHLHQFLNLCLVHRENSQKEISLAIFVIFYLYFQFKRNERKLGDDMRVGLVVINQNFDSLSHWPFKSTFVLV
jgi:dolichol kinase